MENGSGIEAESGKIIGSNVNISDIAKETGTAGSKVVLPQNQIMIFKQPLYIPEISGSFRKLNPVLERILFSGEIRGVRALKCCAVLLPILLFEFWFLNQGQIFFYSEDWASAIFLFYDEIWKLC